jgi:hypothetical protein
MLGSDLLNTEHGPALWASDFFWAAFLQTENWVRTGLFSAPSATQFKRELHDPANVIR